MQPLLQRYADTHPGRLDMVTYRDLCYRVYWGVSRYGAYFLPLLLWPFLFKESPLDLGLRFRGFREHAWIYLLCLVIVIPALVVVSLHTGVHPLLPHVSAGRPLVDRLLDLGGRVHRPVSRHRDLLSRLLAARGARARRRAPSSP